MDLIRRALQVGCGVLGWPPEIFWRTTPFELMAALQGYREKIGIAASPQDLSHHDLRDLRRMLQTGIEKQDTANVV